MPCDRIGEATFGWEQSIHNRPAKVTAIYSEMARVRWLDNRTIGFVSLDALGESPIGTNTETEQSNRD